MWWDLFEVQGEALCAANFRGRVETAIGVAVEFDCLGFFRRPSSDARIWSMSGSVIFLSSDPRYHALTARPAVWEGTLDIGTYRHKYRIYRSKDGQEWSDPRPG